MTDLSMLDRYLPEQVRSALETQFYARVNAQSKLESLIYDTQFMRTPLHHIGLYGDHGVVHVRNVAVQIRDVIDKINGVLIPRRDAHSRLFFMHGYGVILAYLHDIGMNDMSPFGRSMHPEFASQYVFSKDFTPLLETIWEENCGNIAWRLVNLAADGALVQPPVVILREILSMSNAHGKSKVPVEMLNDPAQLREMMRHVLSTELNVLYLEHTLRKAEAAYQQRPDGENESTVVSVRQVLQEALTDTDHSAAQRKRLGAFYQDFESEAFAWLVSDNEKIRMLRDDVIDTLRALRCADALRQRGTVLKTSGSYEIFVDQMSANAVYALRLGDDQLLMLEVPNELASGEANLAASELCADGNLRIGFHRGAFASPETTQKAAHCAAIVVDDIQSDVILSFKRSQPLPGIIASHDIKILLEGVDDNLEFADRVVCELERLNPSLSGRIRAVPSLQSATSTERELYLRAPELTAIGVEREELIHRLAATGQRIEDMDFDKAFDHVKLIHIEAGVTLIEAGTPASFVYVPLQHGLKILPLGGYQAFDAQPWMPLGSTGVIRGAVRNATVICDQAMDLLMIPKEVYLRWWHNPYTPESLVKHLSRLRANGTIRQ